MAVLQGIWTDFKTQVEADSTLDTYVSSRFLWSREPDVHFDQNIPHVRGWVVTSPKVFDAFPKRKEATLSIIVHGKVKAATAVLLESELLKIDEFINNAIDSDLTINGKGRILNSESTYTNLDGSEGRIGQVEVAIEILSIRYIAGSL